MDREVSQTYLVQQIMTASPAKLVAMLYERAITLLHETVDAIEAGDIERRWRANGKAMEIIGELWQALDMEAGRGFRVPRSSKFGRPGKCDALPAQFSPPGQQIFPEPIPGRESIDPIK